METDDGSFDNDSDGQGELYLVLDHTEYGLETEGNPTIKIWPNPEKGDEDHWVEQNIIPGDVIYIPAGIGHWANNALIGVVALRKFFMRNEIPCGQTFQQHAESLAG